MRKLLLILSLFAGVAGFSQGVPQGVPQLFGGPYYEFRGHVQINSSILMNTNDTNFIPIKPAIVYKVSDKSLYYYDMVKWNKVMVTGQSVLVETDPTVSPVIKNITTADTTHWGKVYVDSIRREPGSDSVFYYTSAVKIFAFKDSSNNTKNLIDSVYKKAGTDSVFFSKGNYTAFAFVDNVGSTGSGEINTASNQGIGAQVYQQKVGVDLRFRTILSANSNLTVTQNFNDILLTSKSFTDSIRRKPGSDSVFYYINNIRYFAYLDSTAAPNSGEANKGGNSGTGERVFRNKSNDTLIFKTLVSANGGLTITSDTNEITFDFAQQTIYVSLNDLRGAITPSSNVMYWMTDAGKEGYWRYDASDDSSADDTGTIAVSSGGARFKRVHDGIIDPAWWGVSGDGTSTSSVGGDDSKGINAALRAAGTKYEVRLKGSGFYLDTTVTIGSNQRLSTEGIFYVKKGIRGFVVTGSWPWFQNTGQIIGLNHDGVDSTTFSTYEGVGVEVRNSDKGYVNVNRILSFYEGMKVLGESNSTPAGSQYNNIYIRQIRNCYIQLAITTKGSAGSNGNWANRNIFYLGQIGGGTSANAGGVFGIKMWKGNDSNQGDPFNNNVFNTAGIEGVVWGIYAEKANQNSWPNIRFEDGAVTNKIYLRQDNTGSLGCFDNFMSGTLFERYFYPGGVGINTLVTGRMLTTSGSNVSSISMSFGGKWTHFTNDDAFTAFAETNNNVIAFDNLDGNLSDRFLIKAKVNGKDRYVPYLYGDTLVANSTFAVPPAIDMVYANRSASVMRVYLPTASLWKLREISVRNIEASQSVKIDPANIGAGEDSIIAPGLTFRFKSNGTVWYLMNKNSASGVGVGDVVGPSSSVDGELVVYNSTTGKVIKRFTGTGFVKSASGVASAQSKIDISDLNTTGTASSSTFLRGDGAWTTVSGSGDVSSIETSSADNQLPLFNSTTGKSIKKATSSGFVKLTSGAVSTQPTIHIDYETGGTLPVNRLSATGTRDATTVLYGDNTWKTPPSGGGGSSIFTAGSGTGSPYYRTAGSVNIGVNPSQSYAWTHWGASTSTRALWELTNTSAFVTVPRAHSIDYDAAASMLRLTNGSSISEHFATDINYMTLKNKGWDGLKIGRSYIDAAGMDAGDVLVSDGNDIVGAKPKYDIPLQGNNNTYEIGNTASATTMFSNAVGSTAAIDAPNGSLIKFKAFGYLYTTSGTQSLGITVGYAGHTHSVSCSIPGSLSGVYYTIEGETNFNGSSAREFFVLTIYNSDGTTTTRAAGAAGSWNNTGTLSATAQWGAANASNRLIINAAYFEVFRK